MNFYFVQIENIEQVRKKPQKEWTEITGLLDHVRRRQNAGYK